MTRLGPYTVHPFAEQFPLIEGEEFIALVSDISEHGLHEPIILTHDKAVIVDGRNRYRACAKAKIDPTFENLPKDYTESMILEYIISKNIHRRHLLVGQRSMIAVSLEKVLAGEARKREATNAGNGQRVTRLSHADSGKSRDKAAKTMQVSGSSVSKAKVIENEAPDVAKAIRAGGLTLEQGYLEVKKRNAHKPKAETPSAVTAETITLLTHEGVEVPYPKPKGKPTFNQTSGPGISWAEWSWNPVTGCLHDCPYCYAREIAVSERASTYYPVGFTPLFHSERLTAPEHTAIPAEHRNDSNWKRVFVCSMADLYGRWVPKEWIQQVHDSMNANSQWEYLLLTKFPSRYLDFQLPKTAWVGTSVDEQRRVKFAEDAFRKIEGVRVKWLSLEPLLAPLKFSDLSMFDWVVIGAQTDTQQPSGRVAAFSPPFEWVARLVIQAKESGCKVHMKPNLASSPGMDMLNEYPI